MFMFKLTPKDRPADSDSVESIKDTESNSHRLFSAVVDEKLHIAENRDVTTRFYPGYLWRKKAERTGEEPHEPSQGQGEKSP